jgi:hypothetical protein
MSVETPGNMFGIEFVSENEVPDAPRQNKRDDALWSGAAELLKANPGQFARVKTYDNATGAPTKASAINGGRNKKFPASQWEARYTKDHDKDTSVLFLMFKGDN